MIELVKILGAFAWIFGLTFLFLFPPLGLFVLFIAVLLSIVSVTKVRERRHRELMSATKPAGSRPAAPNPKDKLAALEELRAEGLISDSEYEAKRQAIIDGI